MWQTVGLWQALLSADGQSMYRALAESLTRIRIDDGQVVAQATGPSPGPGRYLHVDPGTGELMVTGRFETAFYDPVTLQEIRRWPVPWQSPVVASAGLAAFDQPTGSLFVPSVAGSAPAPPIGRYHVVTSASGGVRVDAPAGVRAGAELGWFVAAPPPAAPVTLQAAVTGRRVHLSWAPGGPPAAVRRYVLEVGSAPGRADLIGRLDLGAQTSWTADGVPPGVYHVRVRAWNVTGLSSPSHEVVVQVP